ncbi:MAG: M15 family metallopeptidase [Lachnospiraceae bacterium]|nr:M15 family metallopeptidase [Lachnospiraceae bacterium]
MYYDTPQFAPTFREEVIAGRDQFGKKHHILRHVAYPVSAVILGVHRVYMFFFRHAKQISGIVMVSAAFVVNSSFSFPVLSMRAGFVSLDAGSAAAAYEAQEAEQFDASADGLIAEESSATFAAAVDTAVLEDTATIDEEIRAEGGMETGSDLGETVTLNDLLVNDELLLADADVDTDDSGAGFARDDWRLILVNKQHPIPDDYEVELGRINSSSMRCDKRIIGNLLEMFRAAAGDGINLIICSPYRTHEHQEELFDKKIRRYMSAGLSYMDAYTRSALAVTVPGTSEHEIGLAIDIVSDTYASLNEGFGGTQAGEWLAAHSAEYGFILRYPQGKELITGIEYEPWHFRYVGKEAATRMLSEGICLEEFWNEYLYR